MANHKITQDSITVDGRGSLVTAYKVFRKTGPETREQIDLTGRTLYFETDGAIIRETLADDPNDPLGKLIVLENDQVVLLRKTPTRCLIRDETHISIGQPTVLWRGKIARDGYVYTSETGGNA